MQAVSQFDQDDANVLAHRQNHLAPGLGLLFLAIHKIQLAQLGNAVYQVADLRAEFFFYQVKGDALNVFHGVMQQRGCD